MDAQKAPINLDTDTSKGILTLAYIGLTFLGTIFKKN